MNHNPPTNSFNSGKMLSHTEAFTKHESVALHVEALVDRQVAALQTRFFQTGVNDDEEVISRVKHTMRKGETLAQWFARTGLGKSQALKMNRSEISAFVARADDNNAHSNVVEPRAHF